MKLQKRSTDGFGLPQIMLHKLFIL